MPEHPSGHKPLSVPEDIATCPYCEASLWVTIEGWAEDDAGLCVDSIDVHCLKEPPIDSPDWDGWYQVHRYMPYVYQLPVDIKILNWMNQMFAPEESN